MLRMFAYPVLVCIRPSYSPSRPAAGDRPDGEAVQRIGVAGGHGGRPFVTDVVPPGGRLVSIQVRRASRSTPSDLLMRMRPARSTRPSSAGPAASGRRPAPSRREPTSSASAGRTENTSIASVSTSATEAFLPLRRERRCSRVSSPSCRRRTASMAEPRSASSAAKATTSIRLASSTAPIDRRLCKRCRLSPCHMQSDDHLVSTAREASNPPGRCVFSGRECCRTVVARRLREAQTAQGLIKRTV